MAQRGIDIALDLSRMPALARACGGMPIPDDIVEAMEIAAGDEAACRRAAIATGTAQDALVDAARFYLQHLLFSKEADCYRILGLAPGASRATARTHLKLLLKWVHPDRNSGLESVYADRVIDAWRKLSDDPEPIAVAATASKERRGTRLHSRPPLLEIDARARPRRRLMRTTLLTACLLILMAGLSVTYVFAPRLYEPILLDWKP